MNLAFISTINSLNEVSAKGDFDYCIGPFLKDKKYKDYFIKQSKKGRSIIIDDSIAENGGVLSHEELVKYAIEISASDIVVPDVIGDKHKTDILRETFLEKYFKTLKEHNINILCVVQGNSWAEYILSYLQLSADDRVDVIGLPFRMNYATFKGMSKEQNCMWNRILFLNYIKCPKPIHLLGCNLPLELVLISQRTNINKNNFVRGCDSKLMTRYGLSKQLYNTNDETKPIKKFEISDKLSNTQITWALKNISKLKKELKGGKNG